MPVEQRESCVPEVTCNRWDLLSISVQKSLLLQLLASINAALGGTAYTSDQLKEAADAYRCQGSVSKIDEQIAYNILTYLDGADATQPVCWTPLELEGALAFIVCSILNTLGTPT
jgi:hypothetical protein